MVLPDLLTGIYPLVMLLSIPAVEFSHANLDKLLPSSNPWLAIIIPLTCNFIFIFFDKIPSAETDIVPLYSPFAAAGRSIPTHNAWTFSAGILIVFVNGFPR